MENIKVLGSKFEWVNGVGMTDASDINLPVNILSWPNCITIQSHKTGNLRFYFRSHFEHGQVIYKTLEKDTLIVYNN